MTSFLEQPPYGSRDDAAFLAEMNALTAFHRQGCPAFARVWPDPTPASSIEALPFLHVGLFKQFQMRTEGEGMKHTRTLNSSATSSGVSSQISLDEEGSRLQARATEAIFRDIIGDFVGAPLLVLDHSRALRQRGVSARLAAALSLRPLASEIHFLLTEPDDPNSVNWELVGALLEKHGRAIVYGFTWILWQAWARTTLPPTVETILKKSPLSFVHSGGWKKLESIKVDRLTFDQAIAERAGPGSQVIDFYGLVEQPGMIYPLCAAGYRHVPIWADVLVRDPVTLDCLLHRPGQLQLMNTLARGGPYHSVLTEDVGVIPEGPCACGKPGRRFELIGRIPRAEVRGCANV